MQKKAYSAQFGATTACTLRLVEAAGLMGSTRVVIGDSWFSSVKTALQLRNRGVYFIGKVKVSKTIHKNIFHIYSEKRLHMLDSQKVNWI